MAHLGAANERAPGTLFGMSDVELALASAALQGFEPYAEVEMRSPTYAADAFIRRH